MPIYEYRCASCGHELEAMQKISDAPLSECPACAAAALRKRISPVAFRLKGSGWYETDFKSGQQKNLAGKEDAAAKDGDKAQDNGAKTEGAGEKSAPGDKSEKPAASGDGKKAKEAGGADAKASGAAKAAAE